MQPAEELAQCFLERHPDVAAEEFAALPPAAAAAAIARLETSAALALFVRLPTLAAAHCLEHLPAEQVTAILAGLPLREAINVLNRLAPQTREQYLDALPAHAARPLRIGLMRLRDSVAALMDTQVSAHPPDTSVQRVLESLDRQSADHDCQVYVADAHGRFAGMLPLRRLFSAHPHNRVGSLPLTPIAALPASARSAGLVGHPAWLRHTSLPVVDAEGRLVGELRRDRLSEPERTPRKDSGGPFDMAQTFLESYTAGSALLLELLMKGANRRG
ncbi:MAG: hypothetical protein OQL11_03635 [Gammaproteobacteria bacterium]|nr:hypothetical protein [Gammaproteobacteria bacterium]